MSHITKNRKDDKPRDETGQAINGTREDCIPEIEQFLWSRRFTEEIIHIYMERQNGHSRKDCPNYGYHEPVTVVMELIITGEGEKGTKPWAQ